ncbi:MAG: hypothetical protein ACFE89_07335 [Candidatus Hodarchaeota archaeon]
MAEPNTKLIPILRILGILFLIVAAIIPVTDLAFNLDWNLTSSIIFIPLLLVCGLCFGIAGLMAENPERAKKLFVEWLIVVGAILIWVIWVYAQLQG